MTTLLKEMRIEQLPSENKRTLRKVLHMLGSLKKNNLNQLK